ncbi:MFS transporter [Nonomuraea mesophila]|uniref:MFS transporter n=2 Tax=Nonomuraea mesophila TaxID=2530382 RepID=A0A4V2ZB92_9ACTN|nr:MFS transporter [Nonomuraea mesophila]
MRSMLLECRLERDMSRRSAFGYPRWFTTIFLTDIWERFSFYGMMAILTLYAASSRDEGGLGLSMGEASALFGAYIGLVFVLSLPGGWLGDRVFGAWRAVLWGGVLIALGHYSMAVPGDVGSYAGLVLIALGTGLLKPNMFALISGFFGTGQRAKREASFSILYVSIQISALIAPLVVGFLGETLGWHWGFAAAGVGMTFGVAQFAMGSRHFGEVGQHAPHPAGEEERAKMSRRAVTAVVVLAALITVDVVAGTFAPMHLIGLFGLVALTVPFLYFRLLSRNPELDGGGRQRLRAFFWLLLSFSLFWMLAGQAGSMLNLFAKHSTERELLGFVLPGSWFQSAIPFFILVSAPVFAWLWVRFDAKISSAMKFGAALILAGTGFVIMCGAAASAEGGNTVSPLWLLSVFFLIACGEVIIGPVGIAAAAEVTSSTFIGRTIGLVWLFSALGAGLSSQIVHIAEVVPDQYYYLGVGALAICAGFLVAGFGRRLRFTAEGEAKQPVADKAGSA